MSFPFAHDPRPGLNPGSVAIHDVAEHRKDGPYVIGFSNAGLSNPWRVAMLHGIEAAAERNKDKLERFISAASTGTSPPVGR